LNFFGTAVAKSGVLLQRNTRCTDNHKLKDKVFIMNRLLVGFVVIAMILVAAPSTAQDDDVKFNLGVKAGWFFFTGDELKDEDIDNSWIVGADVTAWFNENLGVGAGVQFVRKSVDLEGMDGSKSVRAIPLNLDLYYKAPMDEGSHLYLGAGPSLVLLDLENDAPEYATTFFAEDKAWGINAVAGFQMQNFFVEGQYLWAKASIEDHPDADKLQVGGFSVMAGYRF
jgi:hypothetical protein